MKVTKKFLWKEKGEDIFRISLENDNNIEVDILNLGGIISSIFMEDKKGNKENIVVGWKNPKDYIDDKGYTGAIIGRTAGRIADGYVVINENIYELTQNQSVNTLHGGIKGLNTKIWKEHIFQNSKEVGVVLKSFSEDGEDGYPGNLKVKVKYSLNNENELSINYYGISDKKTLLNFTNHSYFNLSGNLKRDILNEILTVKGSNIALLREDSALSGHIMEVENTAFDFKKGKAMGKHINEDHNQLKIAHGYDHPWILDKTKEYNIKLEDKLSGRIMEVYTDRKAVVIYSTNFPEDTRELTNGGILKRNYAICLETQNLPIACAGRFIEDSIIDKDEEYRSKTVFKFKVVK